MNRSYRKLLFNFALALFSASGLFGAAPVVLIIGPIGAESVTSPLRAALEARQCQVTEGSLDAMPSLIGVDVVVLSDRLVRNDNLRADIFANAIKLINFLENGGVIMDCSAGAPETYWPHFLPLENRIQITLDEMSELQVLRPEHPMGRELQQALTPLDDSRMFKSVAPISKGAICRQRGFSVIAANDALGMYGLLLEAAIGRGRAYICMLPVDSQPAGGNETAQAGMQRIAGGLAGGLVATVGQIKAARLAAFRADTGADTRAPFSWRIIVLPDTQCYVDVNKAGNEKHYHKQIRWIVDNKQNGDIRYVLHLGDVTQHNTPVEWAKARAIMAELNGQVPYLVVQGNHDIGTGTTGGAFNRGTLMAGYFPVSDARKNSNFAGAFKEDDPANVYHLLNAGGADWLILGLEFGPRDEVVRWARKIVDQYPRHRLILVTHAYLYDDDTRYDFKLKGLKQDGNPQYYGIMGLPGYANDGEQLWQGVVSKANMSALVVSGHVLGDGLGYLMSIGDNGKKAAQMLVNFQNRKEGGGGYLRILEFNKDGTQLRVMDYSPSTDRFMPGYQSQFKVDLR
jgi:hypothetical protein